MTPDPALTSDTIATIAADIDRALALHGAGESGAAAEVCRSVLEVMPGHVTALHLLGVVAIAGGDFRKATELLARAAAGNPADAGIHFNHAVALAALNLNAEATRAYERCLENDPGNADAHNNLGHLLWQSGRNAAALAHFDHAIALRANSSAFHLNRAVVRADSGFPKEALADCERALELAPLMAQAHFQRGHVLTQLHRMSEALTSFDNAVALNPGDSKGWNARGLVQAALGQGEAALASYDEALRAAPTNADALVNRAAAYAAIKRPDAAFADLDRALAINPTTPYLRGIRLRAKLVLCEWRDIARDFADLADAIAGGEKATPPWDSLALTGAPALQRQAAAAWAADRAPADGSLGAIPARVRGQRIKLGYFSADFHNHATAHLMAELFERHDRSRFELVAFSFGPDRHGTMRMRIQAAFDEFIDVRHLSDGDVTALARAKGIDIAVDLKGYTGDARPGIFARRAAPVQVSYLGYPGTMGADYIDYIIADRVLIPETSRADFSEIVATLPHSYQVNDSKREIAEGNFTRAELGLPPTGFVFSCFNSAYKITPEVFAVWMRLLVHTPGAVLWLLADNAAATFALRKEAAARGVEPARLIFAPRMAPPEHLARHRAADLFLDTLPCCAHTTASDALWAGLPLLTCLGEALAGRVAASLLTALDLQALIAPSLAVYEDRARTLAATPAALAEIKDKLARNRVTSPLFDSALFARHIEAAYVQMIERRHAGLAPDHFHVAG